MREPKALTALASLLDIDEEYAADMISTVPEAILERNRAKLERRNHDASQRNQAQVPTLQRLG